MGHGVVPRAVAPVISPARMLSLPGLTLLNGTAHGTFFAHGPSPASGVIYNLFASGKIEPVGHTLLFAGFQTRGFTASDHSVGTIIFEAPQGNLFLRLTPASNPTAAAPALSRYHFAYEITHGSGAFGNASGSGTVDITLQPINTNIHGKPVSNPRFFGNSTLTFQSGPVPLT